MAKFTAVPVCSFLKIAFKTTVPYPFSDRAIGAMLRKYFEKGLTYPSAQKISLETFLSGAMNAPMFKIGDEEGDIAHGIHVYEEAAVHDSLLTFNGTYRDLSMRDYIEILFSGNPREIFLACARHGEKKPFGFSIPNPPERKQGSGRHLSLAFPGRGGYFEPLYIGINRAGREEYLCLTARADSDISDVHVRLRKVAVDDVPVFLQEVCMK